MTVPLSDLGWDSYFQAQIGPDETDPIGRVGDVHRDRVVVRTTGDDVTLEPDRAAGEIAVGDWVQFDGERNVVLKVFERKTTIHRRAAGTMAGEQLMAANVDTLFIVTSCNADFNPARLERYLTLAVAGDIAPVIVLTKADLSEEAEDLRQQAARLSPLTTAISVNALDQASVDQLLEWLQEGETGALVGSSGVGKSTILNALTGAQTLTQGVREVDAKGRHTTTSRSLLRTRSGGWLIDTPGIRQLAVVDSADAIDAVFSDVTDLAGACRFSDCFHESEPGCAVNAAIEAGTLDAGRLHRWRKLHLEDRNSTEASIDPRSRHKTSVRQGRNAATGKRRVKRS